jgi:hypothetical protein
MFKVTVETKETKVKVELLRLGTMTLHIVEENSKFEAWLENPQQMACYEMQKGEK